MAILVPKKRRVNEKLPEIERFKLMLKSLGIKTVDIANKSDLSLRTINNFIWNNEPLSGQLLRDLYLNFNVSIDWLLTGHGSMLLGDKVGQPTAAYTVTPDVDSRTARMCDFVQQFMSTASPDERVWLEMQLKLHVPQYQHFLERYYEK